MALSTKVITAYKDAKNSVIQVEKDARVALRTQAVVFGLRVRAHALKLMESQKRKSLKLGDVVTGVAAQLALEFPTLQIDNFIDAIFRSSVPYNVEKTSTGDKLFTYSTFTDAQTAALFKNNDGHVQIDHKNTLRISEIERLLATTRKAHRTANAFLAICVDQYVQNLLSIAESRVTHDKKKRVKVDHLQLPALSAELKSAFEEFQRKKSKEVESEPEVSVAPEPEVSAAPKAEVAVAEVSAAPDAEVAVAEPPAKKARGKKNISVAKPAPVAAELAAEPAPVAAEPAPVAAEPAPVVTKPKAKKTKVAKAE